MTSGATRRAWSPRALAEGFHGKGGWLLLALAVLVADQWTKWLVETRLAHHASVEVIPGLFNLTHVRNTGVAFGLFASPGADGGSWILAALGILALVLVTLYFVATPRSQRLLLAALALVMGGAVGNLLDRIFSGAVTDFLDVYVGTHHWPSFNLADSAITVGIALMAVDAFSPRHRTHSEGAQAEEEPTAS